MISSLFYKAWNAMINEYIVTVRNVNMQTMEFDEWCEFLSDGSTVTAADVAAVMKQIEKRLPTILSLNTKVTCSPEGLIFRPKVSGCITQSQLKARLEAKKAAETDPEKAAEIDVNRELTTSDLSISDCTASIEVDLPKVWNTTFQQKAKLKRVAKEATETGEETSGESTDSSNTTPTGGGSGTEPQNPDNGGGDAPLDEG